MSVATPRQPPLRRRATAAVNAAILCTLATWLALTVYPVVFAEPQYDVRDGLYPGCMFCGMDSSGDPDILRPTKEVALEISLLRCGTKDDIYYDRRTIKTTKSAPPLPAPPPGWGECVTANRARLKNRPEFVAMGVDRPDVDWLAVGRGQSWSSTDIHWSPIARLAARQLFPAAILGALAGLLFVALAAVHTEWRRRRFTDRCTACGYSLKGLSKSTRCPECGQAAPP